MSVPHWLTGTGPFARCLITFWACLNTKRTEFVLKGYDFLIS